MANIHYAMAPLLIAVYSWLARKEEKEMIHLFGDEYISYMNKVPRFIPKIPFRSHEQKSSNPMQNEK